MKVSDGFIGSVYFASFLLLSGSTSHPAWWAVATSAESSPAPSPFTSSSLMSSASDNSSDHDDPVLLLKRWMQDFALHPRVRAGGWVYSLGLPLVLTFGVVGNVCTLLLQCRLSRGGGGERTGSMGVYVRWLAVSDLLTLLCSGLVWYLALYGIDVATLHAFTCKAMYWLSYAVAGTSSWILVTMTTHRAASIFWPHRSAALRLPAAARLAVATVFIAAAAFNAHVLYGRRLVAGGGVVGGEGDGWTCGYVSAEYAAFAYSWWPWMVLVATSLLPFFFIVVANVVLISAVGQSLARTRLRLTATPGSTAAAPQLQQRQRQASGMTLTLVCVSLSFLLLTSPLCVLYLLQLPSERTVPLPPVEQAAESFLASAIANVLWLTNTAVNFYIYILTGTRYRKELSAMLACCCRRRHLPAKTLQDTKISLVTLY